MLFENEIRFNNTIWAELIENGRNEQLFDAATQGISRLLTRRFIFLKALLLVINGSVFALPQSDVPTIIDDIRSRTTSPVPVKVWYLEWDTPIREILLFTGIIDNGIIVSMWIIGSLSYASLAVAVSSAVVYGRFVTDQQLKGEKYCCIVTQQLFKIGLFAAFEWFALFSIPTIQGRRMWSRFERKVGCQHIRKQPWGIMFFCLS